MSRETAPLTVVVPVYNEAENIRAWYGEASPYLPAGSRVLVVYDFEEDTTVPVVRALQASGAPMVLLRNEGRGVLKAILTGLRAVKDGPVVVSMADLSDDFSALPRMLAEYRAGADVVVASRYMRGGRQIGGPWLKGQLARWGGRSLKWLAGFPVSDASNSYRLYDAAVVAGTTVEAVGGFTIGFEITLKAWIAGADIREVPATWRDRTEGTSRFDMVGWVPVYARLWGQAMAHGLRRRLGLAGAGTRGSSAPHP